MATVEETLAAIQTKILDLEKDLSGLKGESLNVLKAEIEKLKDKWAELSDKRPPVIKVPDAPPVTQASDPLADFMDGK